MLCAQIVMIEATRLQYGRLDTFLALFCHANQALDDRVIVFLRGKYRGRSLSDIAASKPDYLGWMEREDFYDDTKAIAAEGSFSTVNGAVAPQGLPSLSSISLQPTIPLDQIIKADNDAVTAAKQSWGG